MPADVPNQNRKPSANYVQPQFHRGLAPRMPIQDLENLSNAGLNPRRPSLPNPSLPRGSFPKWVFFNCLLNLEVQPDPQQDQLIAHQWINMRASIAYELVLMGKTRCALCSGWGHSYKRCPTANKLKAFSTTAVASTLMKRSRDSVLRQYSRINAGVAEPWSLVSSKSKKRPRKKVFAKNLDEEDENASDNSQ